jgi:hypothetical protein
VARIGLIVVSLAVAWAADAALAVAEPDNSAPAASYSTGRRGSRLKWVSPRPQATPDDGRVNAAGHSAPTSGMYADPFGDKTQTSDSAAEPPRELPLEPRPAPIDNEPTAGEQPYIPQSNLPPMNGNGLEPLPRRDIFPRKGDFMDTCPSPKDLKNIKELGTNITPTEGELPRDCPLGDEKFKPRSFAPITYCWTASGLCHKPLYFEDVQLERYGHMAGPWVQPFASGAHFFLTFPILPYKMGLEPPAECLYTLGYYRPGNCAPYLFDPLPLSVRAALFQAGGVCGAIWAFP